MAALIAGLAATPAPAQDGREGLVEEPLKLAATLRGSKVTFDALVIRPAGSGPYPLALITHGAIGDYTRRAAHRTQNYAAPARELARRGWAAVIFLRLGYGATGGEPIDAPLGGCSGAQYEDPGNATAVQMRSAIEGARNLPFVDPRRAIAMGVSAGGFGAIALAANPPEDLLAVVNFAGGRGSNEKGEVCRVSELTRAMRVYGGRSKVPTLWVYAENDRWFVPAVARSMHESFTAAGGKAELLMTPPSGEDGHGLMARLADVRFWAPTLDDFLRRNALPTWQTADLAFERIPGARDRMKPEFEKYLAAGSEKAFAISASGVSGWRSGRGSTEEARRGALENCAKGGARDCHVVVVNFEAIR